MYGIQQFGRRQCHRKQRLVNKPDHGKTREQPKGIDGKGMTSKCGWGMKKAMRLRFLFVQPGVVPTCSVTERISFVNSFAALFRKGVLEFVWNFHLVGPFLRHVSKAVWCFDCWLFGQSSVCHFLENSTPAFFHFGSILEFLHISDKRWILFPCQCCFWNSTSISGGREEPSNSVEVCLT